MFAHISERNINSMLGASFGALVLISAILMLALRSFKLGLLSLIPNFTILFDHCCPVNFFEKQVNYMNLN